MGLSWVFNHPEVTTVLSGMNTMDQITENIKTSDTVLPNSLVEKDLALINNVKAQYNELIKVQCTECGKCETLCPQHLEIKKYLKEVNAVINKR